jgi:hypothetical protein
MARLSVYSTLVPAKLPVLALNPARLLKMVLLPQFG